MKDAETSPSPFHPGEQQVQARLGARDNIEAFARKVVRDHMPEQHRDFFAQLAFVLIGATDAKARPWASMLTGATGFITSPDPTTLEISALPPPGDPLANALQLGSEVGILGICPATRRRNRATGRIARVGQDGLVVAISQSFGNCPQYIQARAIEADPRTTAPSTQIVQAARFDARTRQILSSADTLFIATAYTDGEAQWSRGADVSHRGGKPGFVRVEDERTFVFPDFSGNNHFNTVGNLVLNPKAGFLFPDFQTRDMVYLTGTVDIIWEGPQVRAYEGAERLIRFHAEQVICVPKGLPLRSTFIDASPVLARTGSWHEADRAVTAEKERNDYAPYEVFDAKAESETITSFYLRRLDGGPLAPYEPGQFLPIRLTPTGHGAVVTRTYTLSDAPGAGYYRLSVKREGGTALVSGFLHDHARPGFQLEAMAPRGKFTLDRESPRPVVLISAGVGITPMIAMARAMTAEDTKRPVWFIHGAQNGRRMAFRSEIADLEAHDWFWAHIRFSDPTPEDRMGTAYHSEGRVDLALIKSLLLLDDYDFYLCGPAGFMADLHDGLTGLGIRRERIHYESFGPATVLGRCARPEPATAAPVTVKFASSGIEAEWTQDGGTLLDLAEEAGLAPEFSCRSGVCGTCAVRLKCGAVDYIEDPAGPRAEGEVLICCATPRVASGSDGCGERPGVVLDL